MIRRGPDNENARHFDAIEWGVGWYALQIDCLTRDRQWESLRTDMLKLMYQLKDLCTTT